MALPAPLSVTLEDKYTLERGRVYLTGVQALVRLPMLQRQLDAARAEQQATEQEHAVWMAALAADLNKATAKSGGRARRVASFPARAPCATRPAVVVVEAAV